MSMAICSSSSGSKKFLYFTFIVLAFAGRSFAETKVIDWNRLQLRNYVILHYSNKDEAVIKYPSTAGPMYQIDSFTGVSDCATVANKGRRVGEGGSFTFSPYRRLNDGDYYFAVGNPAYCKTGMWLHVVYTV